MSWHWREAQTGEAFPNLYLWFWHRKRVLEMGAGD